MTRRVPGALITDWIDKASKFFIDCLVVARNGDRGSNHDKHT